MAHSHTVHLALGALLSACTMCGTGRLTPSLAALAAQDEIFTYAKEIQAPLALVKQTAEVGARR